MGTVLFDGAIVKCPHSNGGAFLGNHQNNERLSDLG